MAKKVGMVFFSNKLKCGVQKINDGFEGVVLNKGAKALSFYHNDKEVSYESFVMRAKRARKILETFNKYIHSDNFDEPEFRVDTAKLVEDFVSDKKHGVIRLKGGQILSA